MIQRLSAREHHDLFHSANLYYACATPKMYWAEVWKYLEPEHRAVLERNITIKTFIEERNCLKRYLSQDSAVYDRYSYPRMLLRNRLRTERNGYLSLQIPYIEEVRDDLAGDDATFMSSSSGGLPPTLIMIIRHYIISPSAHAVLPPVETLRQFARVLGKHIQEVTDTVTQSDLVLMPYPILYVVHVDPLNLDPKKYIAVLWYGHMCLNNGEHDGDAKKTKQIYRVEEYPYTDESGSDLRNSPIVQKIIISQAKVLTGNAAKYWLSEAQSINKAFEDLVKHYLE